MLSDRGNMVLMPLLMLLPLLALPIFWLLPLGEAVLVYLCTVMISALMFRVMRKTMKMPAATGAEGLVGKEAKVVSLPDAAYDRLYLVRLDGELWSAESNDVLQKGEEVTILATKGNVLKVIRKMR